MVKKKSDGSKSKFSLLGILLHPFVRIVGGIFSLLAAVLFGHSRLSRRKKRKNTVSEARAISSQLLVKVKDIGNQLGDFQAWIAKQGEEAINLKETQRYYVGLKTLYSEWTSHDRMEAILGTVAYDPKIGIAISNGLHELRSLNILMEAILRDELLGKPEGTVQMVVVNEHLDRVLAFFGQIHNDMENGQENNPVHSLKVDPES